MLRSPNRVLTTLKSASKIRITSFVPPSKIFVFHFSIRDHQKDKMRPIVVITRNIEIDALAFGFDAFVPDFVDGPCSPNGDFWNVEPMFRNVFPG